MPKDDKDLRVGFTVLVVPNGALTLHESKINGFVEE